MPKVFASSISELQKSLPSIFGFSMPRTFSHQQMLPFEWRMLLLDVIGRLDGFKRHDMVPDVLKMFLRGLRTASYGFNGFGHFAKFPSWNFFRLKTCISWNFTYFQKIWFSLSKLLQQKCFVSGPVCHFRSARCYLQTGTDCFFESLVLVKLWKKLCFF